MADLSVFNLSKNRPAIFQAFDEGRKSRQERAMNQQAMQVNELRIAAAQEEQRMQPELQRRAAAEAEQNSRANELDMQGKRIDNAESEQGMYVSLARDLKNRPDDQLLPALQSAKQRFGQIPGVRLDGIDELMEQISSGDIAGAREELEFVAQSGDDERPQSSSVTEVIDKDGRTVKAHAIVSADGSTKLVPFEAPPGFTLPEAETAQEKRAAQFNDFVARQQEETKQASDRAFNNAIASGDATDMAGAKRGIIGASNNKRKSEQLLMLLDQFETGGFTQGMQNSIQSFFGTRPETEEEAENLMKAQAMILMTNFTGAISEGERAFVLEMAPNFGLSTPGNRRLLNNMIEDADYQIRAGDAAMKGRDAYDSYIRDVVQTAKVRVTEADIVKEYGEDKIAMAMAQTGMTRQQVIDAAIKESGAEKAR